MDELHWYGVRELARRIAKRELSPVEIVDALLRRTERLDGKLRSYITVFADEARKEARRIEAEAKPRGPLHGVPIAVKDLLAVAGSVTTAGSTILADIATSDSTVVARLRAAGTIIIGKLNLHEFAYGPEGVNEHFGTPWNPWDAKTHRFPGGSSSGSGVAVAAGLIPMGIGSDTGGSIRIPAACCGTVGLKPTYGRVSRAGVWPLAWSLDHIGPLTRTVDDAAVILSIIAGRDPADTTSSRRPMPDYVSALDAPVRGLKIGVFSDYVSMADEDARNALIKATQAFRELGCEVCEVSLPSHAYTTGVMFAVFGAEAYALHASMLTKNAARYAPDVRRRLLAAAFLSSRDYLDGQRARRLLRDEVDGVLGNVDCLLCPTVGIAAPPVSAAEVTIGGRTLSVRSTLTLFTRIFNLTGHPVLAVPCGFDAAGLPLSMQLVGRAFDETTILRLGQAYQSATEWHRRRPPVAA